MKKENELDVMYFHGKTTDGYRFTIAGNTDKYKIYMGISVCSERDIFRKSSGRSIATTRLLSERNHNNIGKIENEITDSSDPLVNEFNYFTRESAKFNNMKKKSLLKIFNLYRHKPEFPF